MCRLTKRFSCLEGSHVLWLHWLTSVLFTRNCSASHRGHAWNSQVEVWGEMG